MHIGTLCTWKFINAYLHFSRLFNNYMYVVGIFLWRDLITMDMSQGQRTYHSHQLIILYIYWHLGTCVLASILILYLGLNLYKRCALNETDHKTFSCDKWRTRNTDISLPPIITIKYSVSFLYFLYISKFLLVWNLLFSE